MNLGNLSQVFSLDQMSLCRLSSHGFYKRCRVKEELGVNAIMHREKNKHAQKSIQKTMNGGLLLSYSKCSAYFYRLKKLIKAAFKQ